MAKHNSLGLLVLTISLMVSTIVYPARYGQFQAEPGNSNFKNHSSTISDRIDQLLSSHEMMGFSGSIIVEHEGSIVLRKGYGLADRDKGLAYTPDTFQDNLSVTKSFTSAAILSLESMGKLNLEDLITKFFVDVPDDKKSITIHQLLTHQSGFGLASGRDNEPIDRDDFVARVMQTPLSFEPGTRFDYSNVGYSLLGAIIEHVSGQGYEEFLRKALLDPAGMHATGYVLPSWDDKDFAYGYRAGQLYGRTFEQGWLPDGPGWNLRAAGGLHTNVDDMHRWFSVVLKGNGPLGKDQIKQWTSGHVSEGDHTNSSYGYGLGIYESEWGKVINHNGGSPAFSSDFVWIPSQDFFFYIQGNNAHARVDVPQFRNQILNAAFDLDFDFPPLISAKRGYDPSDSKEMEGDYRTVSGTVSVGADDVRLIVVPQGQIAINAFLNIEPNTRKKLYEFNAISEKVVDRILQGREDAFEGLMREETDASETAKRLIGFIEQVGVPKSTAIVATVQNLPGTEHGSYGGFTTLVQLNFENFSGILGLVWNDDGTYRGRTIGDQGDLDRHLPRFVLIPVADGEYTAVERSAPWRTVNVLFKDGCIELKADQFCRK